MATDERPTLEVGTTHAGFEVTDIQALPELEAEAYVMRHVASGARTLWISCDDDNKSFAIAFKTPPANDTGVFHILEHSVLCGSDRFPVKEPFVNLLKTSMQTFLNALTFADKTMYPVASTNTADLENLMDVYLDAVLHPAIYHRPRIFEQEGWHYELTPAGELTYNGVVFNEMKGATSDPNDVLYHGTNSALFPDTPYGFESGGDPRAIPTLTYEEFLDNHARHYNLANSYIILYGDMDIERELAFVGERLDGATTRDAGAPNPLPLQAPVRAGYRRVEMATAPENASVALVYVLGTYADRERVLAFDVLLDAIAGSNEAPLKRAVLDAGISDDFSAFLVDGEMQPRVVFQLKGAREGVAEEFRELIEGTCARLAREGVDRVRLEASLAQAEFNLREQDFGSYPAGIFYSMMVMSSWLYDDNRPVDYLRFENELEHMRQGLDEGCFEQLLQTFVCESEHCCYVELVPVEEGAASEEAAELAQKLAGMSEDDIAHINDEVAALRAEQEAPDAPEDLAKLPVLTVADIDPAKPEPPLREVEAPLPCLAHELPTRGIDYVYHYFDIGHLDESDLPYVSVMGLLLGNLGTARRTAAELDTYVELNLGSLDFATDVHGREDDIMFARPQFSVAASALSGKVEQLATIPREVWAETDFSDVDRIYAVLQQQRFSMEQTFVNAGHAVALSHVNAQFSMASRIANVMSGISFYRFLRQLLDEWDERKRTLPDRLQDLARRVFLANNVIVSFVGPESDRDAFWKAAGTLGLVDGDVERRLDVAMPTPRNEAFVIPSNVSFVAASMAPSTHDEGNIGTWAVAQRVLAFDYLWDEVRVKGGAYGTGFRRTHVGLGQFWSYRDPNIDDTVARYGRAADWLKDWQADEEELSGYVVSTVAAHDAPVKPRLLARRQDGLRFAGYDPDWRNKTRAQKLAATVSDIKALARPLADFADDHIVCVFGPRDAIEASSIDFAEVCELIG